MAFESGTYVWAKCSRLWWAAQVTDDFPEDLISSRSKKPPFAVVKYMSGDDEYQVIKSEAEIIPYQTERKSEFIRKGRIHYKSNKKELEKFISDAKIAEKGTGGSEEFVDSVSIAPPPPRKSIVAEIFKPALQPSPVVPPPVVPGSVKFNFRKGAGSPAKKARASLPTPQVVDTKKFSCDHCGFTADRIDVIISHRKTHAVTGSETTAKASPQKPAVASVPRSPPKLKPQTPLKKAPVAKPPVVRKRKAPKEQAKQDILADWSDDEGGDVERREKTPVIEEDVELKKPRTDKELSDAFESLLKTTKPPSIDEVALLGVSKVKETEKKTEVALSIEAVDDNEPVESDDMEYEEPPPVLNREEPFIESEVEQKLDEPISEMNIQVQELAPSETSEEGEPMSLEPKTEPVKPLSPTKSKLTLFERVQLQKAEKAVVLPEVISIEPESVVGEPVSIKDTQLETLPPPASAPESPLIAPLTEEIAPQTEQIAPQIEEIAPQIEEIPPQTEEIAPQTEQIAPQTDEIAPQTEKVSMPIEPEVATEPVQEAVVQPTVTLKGTPMGIQISPVPPPQPIIAPKPIDPVPFKPDMPLTLSELKPVVSQRERIAPPQASTVLTESTSAKPVTSALTLAKSSPRKSGPPPKTIVDPPTGKPAPKQQIIYVASSGSPSTVTVKGTLQGIQIKPGPQQQVVASSAKPIAADKVQVSAVGKVVPAVAKPPPDALVLAVKSAPKPYVNVKLAKGAHGTPSGVSPAFTERILVLPPVAPPKVTAAALKLAPAPQPKPTPKGKKPAPTTAGTVSQTKFIQLQHNSVKNQAFQATASHQRQGIVTYNPATGQIIQPELCPVISQTQSTKIHGMPQGSPAVKPALVQTVQSVATKVHASVSTAPRAQTAVRQTAKTFSSPNILSGSQPTSASQMLQQQQQQQQQHAISQIQLGGLGQNFQIISQAQPGQPQEMILISQPNQQAQYFITQSGTGVEATSTAAAGKPKKQPPKKKAPLTYPAKKAESPTKPTAAVKPTMSDDEAKSAKLRQALQGQANPVDEKERFVAEKIVHLLPVENIDGTMTYMFVELDEHGTVQINSTEGPSMTQEPPEVIFVDRPTDGQKLLQAMTAPIPLPGKAIGVVQRDPIKIQPGPVYAQPKPNPSVSTPISPSTVTIQATPPPPLVETVQAQAQPSQSQPTQALATTTESQVSYVQIQSNGEPLSEVQVSSAEPVEVPQEDIQLEMVDEGQMQVIMGEDGSEQQVLTLEDVMSQGGQIQFEGRPGEFFGYSDGSQQVQLSDGSFVDLAQYAGTEQVYLLQEDGTLIDPVAMGIDLSTLIQQAPGPS